MAGTKETPVFLVKEPGGSGFICNSAVTLSHWIEHEGSSSCAWINLPSGIPSMTCRFITRPESGLGIRIVFGRSAFDLRLSGRVTCRIDLASIRLSRMEK
jgi:hypothetical protein